MTSLSFQTANSPIANPPLSSKPVVVSAFENQDAERWDRFVLEHSAGTFFHQMAWKRVLEKTFDHEAQYIYGERDGRIVAIAPVFMVSNWMVGRCLVSSPLASYGGICAGDSESEEALLEFLKRQAQDQQVDYLELRNPAGGILPGFPRSLFANLIDQFGKQIDVLVVYAGQEPVASAVSFLFRDTMHPYYIGGLPVARDLAANNFLWWELMKFAAQSGMNTFDFGRSKKGTGAYAFKKKWNPKITDLDYQVFLVRRKTAPNFSPANPKFEVATQVWSRLPLWLTNRLGPRVVRWIP